MMDDSMEDTTLPDRASLLQHHTPSAGTIVKKLLGINPDLGVQDLIQIVSQSVTRQAGGPNSEFGLAQSIDEEKAIRLAYASLPAASRPSGASRG